MLVLSRDRGQSIFINGRQIEICVLRVDSSGRVRLGIKAPQEMSVHRAEVLNKIERDQFLEGKESIGE